MPSALTSRLRTSGTFWPFNLSTIVGAPMLKWEVQPRQITGFPTPFRASLLLFAFGAPALLVLYVAERAHGRGPLPIDWFRAAAVLVALGAHAFVWLRVYRPLDKAGIGAGNIPNRRAGAP